MSVTFVAISLSLELMFEAFVEILEVFDAISVTLDAMLVLLVLILDSTSESEPRVKVPSISASFKIVTVPEPIPKERSPVEKSPVIRLAVLLLPM